MYRGLRIGTVAVAAVGVLAACGSGPAGMPGSTGDTSGAASTQTSAATGTPNGEAPKVPSPLPTGGIIANPCSALSTSQMTALGVKPPGNPSTDAGGPVCQWPGAADASNAAFVHVLTTNKNGLSDIYANHDDGKFAYFETTQVEGYPGVYAEAKDDRAAGSCSAWVGLTDQLAVGVSVTLLAGPNKADPCNSANKIATAMIEHLKGAA